MGASLIFPETEAGAVDVESESSQASAEDEAAGLLGGQGTVKKRTNGKPRQSEDSDSLLVVVPDAEGTGTAVVRRSMEQQSLNPDNPMDSMDENAPVVSK